MHDLCEAYEMVKKTISQNTGGYAASGPWHIGTIAEKQSDNYLVMVAVATAAMRRSKKALQIGVSKYPISSATYHANNKIGISICTCDALEPQIEKLERELNPQI